MTETHNGERDHVISGWRWTPTAGPHEENDACDKEPVCGYLHAEPTEESNPTRSTVVVYTTRDQAEQGITVRHVTALTVVGGLLTIEADVQENGYTFSAYHRFERGQWAHVDASYNGGDGQ